MILINFQRYNQQHNTTVAAENSFINSKYAN